MHNYYLQTRHKLATTQLAEQPRTLESITHKNCISRTSKQTLTQGIHQPGRYHREQSENTNPANTAANKAKTLGEDIGRRKSPINSRKKGGPQPRLSAPRLRRGPPTSDQRGEIDGGPVEALLITKLKALAKQLETL